MNFHCLKLCVVNFALCAAASAQINELSVFRTTNNFNDLNASRDALGMPVGDMRITHTITDGSAPISFEFLTSDIYLQVISRVDGWTNHYRAAFETNELATVRWNVFGVQRGEYLLYCEITTGGNTYPVFDRYLTVTNAPSASGASVIVSNQIFLAGSTNIESQTVNMGGATNFVGVGGISGGVTGDTITVDGSGVSGGGGVVSNVTESTSNKWDAATGSLIINTSPVSGASADLSSLSNAVALSLTSGAASVNGSLITNGAVITLSGGLTLWGETNGTIQNGTWLYATNVAAIPVNTANAAPIGPYISTNRSFTLRGPPNGLPNTTNSSGTGNALGAGAVDLQTFWVTSTSYDNLAADVASGFQSFIGGGAGHKASGDNSTIGGGLGNVISSAFSTIPGGNANNIAGSYGVIGGGQGNSIAACSSCVIAGGVFNVMDTAGSKDYSSILGGYGNIIKSGAASLIGGGYLNQLGNTAANFGYNGIFSGTLNTINSTAHGTIIGGIGNSIVTSTNVVILQGYRNAFIGSTNAVILQGNGITNNARHNIAIVGGDLEVRGRTYIGTLGDYLTANGTNLFYYNSTGGVAQVSTL